MRSRARSIPVSSSSAFGARVLVACLAACAGTAAFAPTPATAATTEYFDQGLFRSAAAVATVVVDFEETQRGNALDLEREFAEEGLSIVALGGQPSNVVTVSDASGFAFVDNAASQEHVLSGSIGLGGAFSDVADDFDFVFDRPKRAAGLWIGNVDPGSTLVQFLDADGNVLESEMLTGAHPGLEGSPGGRNRIFYGVVSDPPVARIRTVEGAGDSDGVTYDDVEYAAASEVFDHAAFAAGAGWRRAVRDFELEATAMTGGEYSERSPDGVRIEQRQGGPLWIATVGAGQAFPANASSGAKVLSSSIQPDGGFGDGSDDLDFVFDQPMRAAGLWIGNLDPGTTAVEFLGPGGELLASEVLDGSHAGLVGSPGGANRLFYGIVSDAPIARIRTVESTGDGDGITYDDVQFSPDLSNTPRVRVLTANIWQWAGNAAYRQAKLADRIRRLAPDLIALQEANQTGIQVDLLAQGYTVRHQRFRDSGPIDQGVLIASRWPLSPDFPDRVSLEMPGADLDPYALVRGIVEAPPPFGDLYFINPKPAWEHHQATQRSAQAVLTTDTIWQDIQPGAPAFGLVQILAGDLDDVPASPSVGHYVRSKGFRDSWIEAGSAGYGHTFTQPAAGTPERYNDYSLPITGTIDPPPFGLYGFRRIDYLLVRDGWHDAVRWHASRVVFDGKGLDWISAHYGVFGELRLVPEPSGAVAFATGAALLLALADRRRRGPAPGARPGPARAARLD